MGTLVHLDEPVPRLRAALAEHAGLDVDLPTAAAALKAEIAFYRAHLHTAVDGPSLDALRARCAAAMRPALPAGRATDEQLTVALLAGIRFAAYPEVPATLAALREDGWTLVVVSNWDVSLDEVLVETGLRERVDGRRDVRRRRRRQARRRRVRARAGARAGPGRGRLARRRRRRRGRRGRPPGRDPARAREP